MPASPTLFALLLTAASLVFAYCCYRRFRLVALGTAEERVAQPLRRGAAMLHYAFGQARVVARPFGRVHVALFWSFVVLLIANGEFVLAGLFPGVGLGLLPTGLYHALLLLIDLVTLLALGAVVAAAARRLCFPPDCLGTAYVSARSPQAFVILGFIAVLMLASLVMNAANIALGHDPAAAAWQPVASLLGRLLGGIHGLPGIYAVAWWAHALALLAFLCLLPQSKHMHILTAIPNCYFASLERPNTLPREDFGGGAHYGAGRVDQLSWKDLFDSFTCTECGRCQEACPAHHTLKPLNPRAVVHDIKENLLANAPALRRGAALPRPLLGDAGEGSVDPAAVWACTTCGACMAACPVLIEQMPKIVKLRRHLVQMAADFPDELLNFFENSEQRSNPWGIAPAERTKWASRIDAKPFVAGETEYLLYVGCAGAFDNRNKQVTLALAALLDAAGVSWGILGKDEPCCGDSLRRLGNEYVFDQMAQANVAQFRTRGVTKIITQCPHCFSTLKNDYRQYGLEIEVRHHSEVLAELLASGRLELPGRDAPMGTLLYHDSCYLARHNGITAAPRQALAAATGGAPQEFARHGTDTFCCGAGGGRMWLEEEASHRINVERVRQALAEEPDTVCVACPYCLTMFEDGLKDEQVSGVRVQDLAEVLARRL